MCLRIKRPIQKVQPAAIHPLANRVLIFRGTSHLSPLTSLLHFLLYLHLANNLPPVTIASMKKETNYKFKSLQVYNWQNVANNRKKFRQVFDRWELTYLGVELALFNKRYDEHDWEARIVFKVFSLSKGEKDKEVCTIDERITIPKSENIAIIDKGWGDDEEGKFWKFGEYIWEASIDGELLGTAKFYIQEFGVPSKAWNPYFEVLSLKTYEGPDDNLPEEDRKYLKVFKSETSRYIFGEFRFVNHAKPEWLCELFFNYFNDTGQLVGRIPVLKYIEKGDPGEDVYTITHGWGSTDPGSWAIDEYTLEIEFMEEMVAVLPFGIADKDIERIASETPEPTTEKESTYNPGDDPAIADITDPGTAEETQAGKPVTVEEAMKELNELIGLENIKAQIREHISYLDFIKVRKDLGYEEEEDLTLHSVFTGNPGTGKSTVVRLLGKIYQAMGLLSKGHVHTVESSDLVSGYIRQTGKMTKDEIEKARGGILFIDEAYMLHKEGAETDFGNEAIAELITEMSDGEGDIAIMVAGYPEEMKSFINSNPGLKSRFRYTFHFEDYVPSELMKIAGYICKKKHVKLSPKAKEALEKEVISAYRERDKHFGNARMVIGYIEEAKINMGVRVMKTLGEEELNQQLVSTIKEEDIAALVNKAGKTLVDIPTDEELLADTMKELDGLIGLDTIKTEIRNTIKLVRYYRDMSKDIQKAFSIHSIFKGNPGTGKTTIARIMGNIYKALGILERGHLVETDASDLIAGYIGQTALKTKEKIQEAMGGILFIDEAYSITEGLHPEFGKKAVSTLIKQMEDRRGEFSVIVAGYTKPMDAFIESNPGLRSRFDQTFNFEDFTEQELLTIAIHMFSKSNMVMDKAAEAHLKEYLHHLYINRNQFFGNARSVRKITERAIRNQNLRMASLSAKDRTMAMIETITLDDFRDFSVQEHLSKHGIGFKRG